MSKRFTRTVFGLLVGGGLLLTSLYSTTLEPTNATAEAVRDYPDTCECGEPGKHRSDVYKPGTAVLVDRITYCNKCYNKRYWSK